MRKTCLSVWFACLSCLLALHAQVRTEFLLEKNWKFTREDRPEFSTPGFDDATWQTVSVPHDWAIYGPFSPRNDKQEVAIAQDGQQEAMEHAGRTGGLPFVGVGWYRTRFSAPAAREGKKTTLVVDGAMSHAQVYVNGRKAGFWPYGYSSFYLDITPFLNDSGENTLAVRLENLPESSRWYPGAGLYRNLHVVVTGEARIATWGTQISTPEVTPDLARIHIRTALELPDHRTAGKYLLSTEIRDDRNTPVAKLESVLSVYERNMCEQALVMTGPKTWSPENPVLYTAVSKLYDGKQLVDEYTTRFGIRSIEVVPDKGFFLNGKRILFKGVCLHHDLGPLGTAVNEAAIRRQIRLLKDMGCNAIRTSHNMPAPELVRLCDETGMMLMVETFDEWKTPKCQNGYHLYFDEWAEKDLTNVIRQYRNNPSVMMWCIGNEVPDQNVKGGPKLSRFLQNICHREDPTRPVIQGMDQPQAVINNNFAAVMDIPGFNYRPFVYPQAYEKLPQSVILGSETASTLSARGIYKFPVERKAMAKYDDHQSSSYDVEHCSWSNLPEDDFIQHDDLSYCMGEFVWTGFDYLGEPTPYYSDWPSHGSLFGIIDLAGLPKDRYYLYRSHWNPEEKTLHVLPHWNWKGREGEITPIFVYTNYPSAEVFINGKSQGRQTKDLSVTSANSGSQEDAASFKRQKRYRLMWMNTRYEPGTVKVIAYDRDGRPAAETEIHTAGKPYRIELSADRTELTADGKDLSFITVKVVDKDGNLCPDASNLVRFSVKGAGSYRAAANGDATCIYPFHVPEMPVFSGMLTSIVQAGEQPGAIEFKASAKGLKSASLRLTAR